MDIYDPKESDGLGVHYNAVTIATLVATSVFTFVCGFLFVIFYVKDLLRTRLATTGASGKQENNHEAVQQQNSPG